jgi:cytochrome P450
MATDVTMCVERLLTVLESQAGHPIDLHPIMKLTTLDAIALIAFGRDFGLTKTGKPEANPVQDAFDSMLQEHFRRVYSPAVLTSNYWMPTPANLRYQRMRRGIRQFMSDIIADRRALRIRLQKAVEAGETPTEQEHEDLLKHMIRLADEDGQSFTGEDLLDECMTFMCVVAKSRPCGSLTKSWAVLRATTQLPQH